MNIQAMQDMDTLRTIKQQYHQAVPGITYESMKAAAIKVLENRRAAEIKLTGKAKTKINDLAVAALLR